jgi:hypothetical protein
VDVAALVLDVEGGGFVTGSVAFLAGEFDVGEELHFDGDGAVSLADVAASARDVEGEAAGGEALALGVGLGGEEGADLVEGFDICNRIGSRGAADGRLVDEDDVVEVLGAGEGAVEVGGFGRLLGAGAAGFAVEQLHERAVEHLVDERGLARAADAGDAAEQVERDVDVDAAQVVDARAGEAKMLAAGLAAVSGDGDGQRPDRYFPVIERGLAVTSATVPEARRWPPSSPAPGPRSSRWSAERMTSGSCSTTRMVLPRSRRECRMRMSLAVSRGCRPMEGSSNT